MQRAVREATMTCRYCRSEFVGTTRLAPDVLPAATTSPHRRRWLLPVMVVVLGVLCAVLTAMFVVQILRSSSAPPAANRVGP